MHTLDVVTGTLKGMILHHLHGIQSMTNLLEHLKVQHSTMQEYGPDHSHLVLKLRLIQKLTRELSNGAQTKQDVITVVTVIGLVVFLIYGSSDVIVTFTNDVIVLPNIVLLCSCDTISAKSVKDISTIRLRPR